MRVFTAILSLIFVSAAYASGQKGILVSADFNFSSGDKKIKAEGELILDQNLKTWATLVKPQDGVTLLGRVKKVDDDAVQMEYLLVDLDHQNVLITTPAISSTFGEKSILTTKGEGASVRIGFLAKKISYVAAVKVNK